MKKPLTDFEPHWRRFQRTLDKGELRLSGHIFKKVRGEVVKVCRASDLPKPVGRHERAA